MFAFAAVFAALPLVAHATLSVLQPTGAGWVGNTTVTVSWKWDATDPNFSIELSNPTIQSGLLAQGPIAVANNVVPNTNSVTFDLPVLPPGNNYQISFVAVSDITNVYATSPAFPLSANPTSSSVTGSNTAALTNNSQAISATTTKSGSSSTKTASGSGTNTITATGSSASAASSGASSASSGSAASDSTAAPHTTLVVSTPSASPSASATSTPSGAAARLSGSFASAALAVGAVVVGAFVVV